MARREGIRRGSRRSFAGLLITAALHGVIFLAVKAAHSQTDAPLIVERDFVRAEMVKLGKPRDKFWLPRITQPPPPPPPDALKIAEDPNAKPAPVEAPKVEDPKTSKDVKRALQRAAKLGQMAMPEEPEEGDAKGSAMGNSNRQVGDPYDAAVTSAIQQNYNLPAGMAPDQIAEAPEIQFKVTAEGTLTGVKLAKPSGNALVDDACVSAAQQTRKVPPPPGGKSRAYLVACRK
jgi:TonB family protein